MAAHIEFTQVVSLAPKTKCWNVATKTDGFVLGQIKWFGRWYQYSFFPAQATVFEKTCLRDIANFCEEQTREQKKGWKRAA